MLFYFTCNIFIPRILQILRVKKTFIELNIFSWSAYLSHPHSSRLTVKASKIWYLLCKSTWSLRRMLRRAPMVYLAKASWSLTSFLSFSEKEILEPRYLKCLIKLINRSWTQFLCSSASKLCSVYYLLFLLNLTLYLFSQLMRPLYHRMRGLFRPLEVSWKG